MSAQSVTVIKAKRDKNSQINKSKNFTQIMFIILFVMKIPIYLLLN